MAVASIISELSWVCALLFLVIAIMLVATCICFKDNEKAPEYGTAGRLSITRDSPIVQHQPRNGSLRRSNIKGTCSEDGNLKRNSWTVKDRALPEIPGSTIASRPLSACESSSLIPLTENGKLKTHSKAQAPKPPGDPSKVFPMDGSIYIPTTDNNSGVTVTITVNDKTQVIGSTSTLKGRTPAAESVPGTSNNNVVLKKVEKVAEVSGPSATAVCVDNVYDTVAEVVSNKGSHNPSVSSSPVCGSSCPSEDGNSSTLSASLAVAGAVPSSDIPYMTPPLHHPTPSIITEAVEGSTLTGRSEVPYTVISVREPLARVREITMRRQRAQQQQQQQREESENHYAMVPEEEQMYAEIGSGQESCNSSQTYAHIEPRELPPVPPTVESLKSVAHAHSRQASTVSTSSLGSFLSSGGEISPPTLRNNVSSLYSTVDKNSNKQRKTIHLAEGVSLAANADKKNSSKKVEDLYAKVRKKRVDLTIRTSVVEDNYQGGLTPPPSPWASTTPPAPPPIAGRIQAASLSVLMPVNSQHVRRHSADPNLPEIVNENRVFAGSTMSGKEQEEPDYEKIYNEGNSGDSCYEKIKDNEDDDKNVSQVWLGASHRNKMSDSVFPGYEGDEDSLDPGYECVVQESSSSDPGYEPVRVNSFEDSEDSNSDYTVVKLHDAGYERVMKKLDRSGSDAADPGYEKIKNLPRKVSDATDPGYERVKNNSVHKEEDVVSEPGYETVQRSDSDTDPGYEVVRQNRSFSSRYGTPSRQTNSTVLYISGNSAVHISGDGNSSNSSSEPPVTFL